MTVKINGRDYGVEVHPEGDILNPDRPRYTLIGPRSRYSTMRNVPNPDVMFIVPEKGMSMKHTLSNVWLSDKTGELRQVSGFRR